MNSWAKKKVLVSGGTGWIGRALVSHLRARGAEVWILARGSHGPFGLAVDLADASALRAALANKTFGAVFHLAAAGVAPGASNASLIQTNVQGTENFLQVLEALPICPVVMTGSWTEYSPALNGILSEDQVCAPASPYGQSKLAASLVALEWAKRLRRPLTVARLFSVYGPGEAEYRLGPTVFRALAGNQAPHLAQAAFERDFVFLDDVIEALLRLAECKEPGLILNVGTGRASTIAAFVDEMQRVLGTNIAPIWGTSPLRPWDVPSACADMQRLQDAIGWIPCIDFSRGIPLAMEGYKRDAATFAAS